MVISEAEAMNAFERAFIVDGTRGFTIVPRVWGSGKTGLKTGTRVHPGGSSLLFSVVADEDAAATVEFVRRVRDESGSAAATKIFVVPVEEP
ncbi:MAG: P-II family nitrogen regulator [Acidobacteriota bacterium]